MVNHFQGVENGCIGNEWVNVSKSKKTDRQYYEYYEWTDEWSDEYYEWTTDTTSGQTSTTSRQTNGQTSATS